MNAHTQVPTRHPSRRNGPGLRTMRLGFVPLTDAAPLLVAEAIGLFDSVGLKVALSAEHGWAALRDKLAFGALEAAHMLGPMPIALAAGLDGVRADVTVAAGLAANGNTVTISRELADEIGAFRFPLSPTAFAAAVRRRQGRGAAELKLAVVFPYSSHNYLLRYWLAKGGLDPDRDLRLLVVPPPMVAKALQDGVIDGFCAGEPWGSHASALGAGRIALATGDIWPNHPEKVLALRNDYVAREPEQAVAATAAILAAARWLDDPTNHAEAVKILRKRAFPGLSVETIAAAFEGRAMDTELRNPLRFHSATLPRPDQAAWWLRQMRHWGHVPPFVTDATALAPWQPDLWRAAATRLREAEPPAAPPPPADLPESFAQ